MPTLPLDIALAYTQRVEVGAYYTNGAQLAEVTRVYALGHVQMRDATTGDHIGTGIGAFRRDWWRVR